MVDTCHSAGVFPLWQTLEALVHVAAEDFERQRAVAAVAVAVAVGDSGTQNQAWAHEGSGAQSYLLEDSEVQEDRAACSAAAMVLVGYSAALAD